MPNGERMKSLKSSTRKTSTFSLTIGNDFNAAGTNFRDSGLIRNSHKPSTAVSYPSALPALRSVGLLDVLHRVRLRSPWSRRLVRTASTPSRDERLREMRASGICRHPLFGFRRQSGQISGKDNLNHADPGLLRDETGQTVPLHQGERILPGCHHSGSVP